MRWLFAVFLAVSSIATIEIAADSKKNDSVFVPTKEWKTVEKGTPVPPGLHVRLNLQTGVTEAKLMDDNDEEGTESDDEGNRSETNSLTLHPEKSLTNEESNLPKKDEPTDAVKIPFDELKAMLKKIKSDDSDTLLPTKNSEQVQPERRKKFRSYLELKEELEALNMNVSADSEVLTSLFNQFQPHREAMSMENIDSSIVEDILGILNNMEYLIHQIDNAQMFTDMGGMTKIISPSLNSTNHEVKAEALRLLGAAVQSNPKVQIKALENDYVQKILHMLTINNKVEVKSRCLFALGALVRHFPAAQKTLINNGGIEIFGKFIVDGNFQVQTRIMNLINDLAIERQNLKEIQDDKVRLRRLKEYDLTNFEEKLVIQKYCHNLADLMIRSIRLDSEVDDFHEVIYESMITLSSICKEEFKNKKTELVPKIHRMLKKYRDSPKMSEEGENLNTHHKELLKKLLNLINSDEHHDEL